MNGWPIAGMTITWEHHRTEVSGRMGIVLAMLFEVVRGAVWHGTYFGKPWLLDIHRVGFRVAHPLLTPGGALLRPRMARWRGASGCGGAQPQGRCGDRGQRRLRDRDIPDVSFAHRDADAFRRYVVDVLGFDPENIIDLRDARRRRMFDALGGRRSPQGSCGATSTRTVVRTWWCSIRATAFRG